jgi:outer membrane lipoprotein-sorting protein
MTGIPPFAVPDDPLDRAADALLRASVPEGPPEETIARTLAALRAASETKTAPFYRRKIMRYALKIAAVVLVAAGTAVYFTGILPLRAPLVFAEVAAKLRDARTLTYEVTSEDPKQKETIKMKIFYKDPGSMRSEGAGQIAITDLKRGKILLLDSTTKTAMLIDYKRTDDAKKDTASMIDELRKLADKKGESVGKKQIGDLDAVGFRVEQEGFPLTVWADPKTKMPVLIEMSVSLGDREVREKMSDFQLDPKLDDAVFSLEPPEGYKLRKMEMKEEKPEDDVVHLLRAYTEKSGGKFPVSLSFTNSEWEKYITNRWGKKPKGLPEPEVMQFMQRAVRVEVLLRSKKEHGYKPEGAKLGDRDKIVFWYRPDKADKYRAVYGDLHVADVSADQLPEKPKK